MKKIAVIDDDVKFLSSVVTYLKGRGFLSHGYSSFSSAMSNIDDSFDLAIIDINLIDGDGLSLLDYITIKFKGIKTIVITGYDDLPKRLKSFARGADDYMNKPIFPSELVARINRILNLNANKSTPNMNLKLHLSGEEDRIYNLLKNADGGLVLRKNIKRTCLSDNAIYVILSRIKKKLPKDEQIKSVYGKGYYLKKVL